MADSNFVTGDSLVPGLATAVNPVILRLKGQDTLEIKTIRYSVSSPCKLIGSPTEMGIEQLDHKVMLPRIVNITGYVKWPKQNPVMGQLRKKQEEKKISDLTCAMMSKSDIIHNLLIESFEETGDAQHADSVIVSIRLKELLMVAKG